MTDAQHYIYIFTASWCGPCLSIMPRIVEHYAEMKENKVEIIVIGCDRSEKMVKKYIEHYRVGLTAIYVKSPQALTFPGVYMPDAFPLPLLWMPTARCLQRARLHSAELERALRYLQG